jgi:hypothetical protein
MRINTANNSVFKPVIAGFVALIMALSISGCASASNKGMDHIVGDAESA